jgi:peroxiredoxin
MLRNLFLLIAAVLLLASCGEDSKHFKIEGRLLQMNQGEFYVYSNEPGVEGIDTIKVQGGRFSFEMPCQAPVTLTLVFPNFSETPIFAEPGKTAKIDGDASHLKMLKVKGTKDNELMTTFRSQISNASPPEIKHYVELFIQDHPKSPVGIWLLRKYFIATAMPDYQSADRLLKVLINNQPQNSSLKRLSQSVEKLKMTSVGSTLPSFTTYDLNGGTISSSQFSTGTAVICVWASWSFDSTDMLRQLQTLKQTENFKILAINVDASKNDCRSYIKNNQMTFPVVCTGDMFETPVLKQLGLQSTPDNIVIKNGKIVGRNLNTQDLTKALGGKVTP